MNNKWILPAALLGTAAGGFGQNNEIRYRTQTSERTVTQGPERIMIMGSAHGEGMPANAAFGFIAAGNADGKVVKNAPYSGESVTETTRILADGTRIVNKNTTTMARDKDGRTRRENELGSIGPMTHNQPATRFVTITDPQSKEVSVLNINEKTAHKVKMGEPMVYHSESINGNVKHVVENQVQVAVQSQAGAAGWSSTSSSASGSSVGAASATTTAAPDFMMATPGLPVPPPMGAVGGMMMRYDSKNSKSDDLGEQVMEGVRVKGTRTTMTIPSGEIGNDRDIVSTTERWYSPELEMVIFTKTIDPQFGETTYRVTNLRRADPDPGMFKVPADFKIQEGNRPMIFNRKVEGPGEEIF